VLEERSSLLGRGRADCILGEPGSFLTLIIGGSVLRCLLDGVVSIHLTLEVTGQAYELGESLPLAVVLSFELLRAP
jgi:hypothetical protein